MGSRLNANNTSQQHGVEFENLIKISRMFAGAANVSRSGWESFDIEGACDPAFGLATSVKTAKGDWIGLADAERFCQIDRPWRLVHGPWVQETDEIKRYDVIHEMIIPLGAMKTIMGDLTPERALGWHNDIASFAAGEEGAAAARRRCAEIKAEIAGRHGLLRLDFKIDGRGQRRLQFSIRFSALVELLRHLPEYRAHRRSQPLHVVHDKAFHQYPLPIRLISPPRRIEKAQAVETGTAATLFDDIAVPDAPTVADPLDDVLGAPAAAPPLRRPVPLRREERERRRRATADTRQIALFG